MEPTGTGEDTYVAVLERAPQKNEEVMTTFTKVEQCQQMGYLSVHGPGVGKGPTVRMAANNDGAFSDWSQFTTTHKGTKPTQLESAQRRIIICWYYRCYK